MALAAVLLAEYTQTLIGLGGHAPAVFVCIVALASFLRHSLDSFDLGDSVLPGICKYGLFPPDSHSS